MYDPPAAEFETSETQESLLINSHSHSRSSIQYQPKENKPKTTTLVRCIFNVTNVILGSGLIGLPFAVRQCGFVTGIILLAITAYLTDFSLRHLVIEGRRTGKLDYEELSRYCFGTKGYYATLIFIFLLDYGSMLAYVVVIGDTIPPVLRYYSKLDSVWVGRPFVVSVVSAVFMLPLSLVRQLKELSFVSMVAVITLLGIVLLVMIQGMMHVDHIHHSGKLKLIDTNVLPAFATMSFAYVCHDLSFQIYQTLENPTDKRWTLVVHGGLLMSLITSLCMAIFGYLSFRDDTNGNILNNFPNNDHLANVARVLLAFTIVATYPLNLFMCRHVLSRIIGQENSHDLSWPKHILISLFLFITSTSFGCFVTDLGIVMSLVGGISAVSIAFIIPAANILKVRSILDGINFFSLGNIPVLILLFFGIAAAVSSTGLNIYNEIYKTK